MSRLLIVALVACGGSPGDPRPTADLSGVAAEFRPTSVAFSDLVGVAYQIPAGNAVVRAFVEAQLRSAGVHHARADLLWNEVEPVRGTFDFSAYHAKVDAYTSAGVTTLPILCYGNPWANATPGDTTVPPDDPADFAAYAGTAATEFRGMLPAYEIWNEENLGFRFWEPREDPDAYGRLLTDASRAIRAADPAATIVFGGLLDQAQVNMDAETFVQNVYRYHPQIGRAYDVLALHPYPLYPPSVAPEIDDDVRGEIATARMVARLRAAIAYWGDDPSRRIWATELGWPTYQGVDEERQARWLVRALLALASAGVERAYWYTMFDGPNPTEFPPEDAFGLFHYADPKQTPFAPTPKPAWTALATLLAIAGPLHIAREVPLPGAPPDAHAYELDGPSRAIVVWRTDDAAAAITVTLPATPTRVVDMLGQPLATSATVPLSGRPVYAIE